MKLLKLFGVAMFIALSTGCSNNMYLPEAHTYSNGIQGELINANICTSANCGQYVKFTSEGVRFHRLEYGQISINVFGISSNELAQKIIMNCKNTRLSMKSNVPITLSLYNSTDIKDNTVPILSSTCM